MTGFGSARGTVGTSAVAVEIRTVNHRFFNPSIKLPQAFAGWEGEVREALRGRIARGHVTLTARIERDQSHPVVINERLFGEYAVLLRDLQTRHGLGESVDPRSILGLPDVIHAAEEAATGTAAELLTVVDAAVSEVEKMREEEGARLSTFMQERLGIVEEALGRIRDRAPERLAEQSARLRRSISELAAGAGLDEQRLAQEVAILADRMDIAEELARFESHIRAFRDSVAATGGEPVGKRLGFLLQELLREANTVGSKAADAQIVTAVVTIKEELERIREQVENVE